MRSLASLLEGAVRRAATEVTLESGQPVVYMTGRGTEAETSILPRTELFDMIVASVNESQQVELAVGNPIEFVLDAGAKWTIHAEPGMEGITVRARCGSAPAAPSLEISLDHGPFDPSADDFGPDPFITASEITRPRPPSAAPPSQLRVQALEVPSIEDGIGVDFNAGPGASGSAFESGTWALEDDDDFEVELDTPADSGSLPTGFDTPAGDPFADYMESEDSYASSEDSYTSGESGGYIGVPDDDDDETSDPFGSSHTPDPAVERRRTLSPTLKAMEASPAKPTPPPSLPPAQRSTQPDLGRSSAGTYRDHPSVDPGQLGDLCADISEGSLVYVRDRGTLHALADAFGLAKLVVSDGDDPSAAWAEASQLPLGSVLVIQLEDPSRLLGWILRRLEQGYRVLVETRAQTSAGGRRVLLGVAASERAERWLDEHVAVSVEIAHEGPRLVNS